MSSISQISATVENVQPAEQSANAIFVATCRAHPQSADPYDPVSLDAGDYQVAWATPNAATGTQPLSFSYGRWSIIAHRKAPEDAAALLPKGDVLIVVHGFHETAPEGVLTGQAVATGLAQQQRTGGISRALSARKPASQSGALRLAQTLQNRLPATATLYQHLIAFTWPGAKSIFPGYLLDKEEVARFAAFSLANLLADLRAAQPERRVLLVAHSMGCYLTIKALNLLSVLRSAQAERGASSVIVDHMAFYAPDVNADAIQSEPLPAAAGGNDDLSETMLARRNGYGFQALDRVGRLTIYYSFHDNALIWSPLANFFTEESGGLGARARLGWCGPYTLAATHTNVVAVDCSACIFDHAAYFIRHEVLNHTARTLAEPLLPLPQLPYRAAPLQTSADGAQQQAKRLWTWYTPAEMAREQWERFFLYKPQWLRGLAAALNTLLTLAIIAGIIFALVKLILQRW